MKRVFITGASRGIGRAVAERYAAAGYAVVAPGRDELDLSRPEAVEAYAARCGGLIEADILVNNAGINNITPLAEMTLAGWRQMQDVNLTAPLLLTRYAAAAMARKGWGRIVNVSSCYSFITRRGRSAYSATKAALNSLTRSAAVEYGRDGILVNAVCPGFIGTNLTRKNNSPEEIAALCAQVPLGRLGTPEEIADLVFMLGSEKNSYITGQTLVIDGGFLAQ
jgi:3-oxoacyl-[acyl-carrier protein] reductase